MQERRVRIVDAYPLTSVQRGMLVEGAGQSAALYAQQIAVRFTEPVPADRLVRALCVVVEEEPVLRSIFDWMAEPPLQIVLAGRPPEITEYDVHSGAQLDPVLIEERRLLSAPESAPPLRFAVITAGTTTVLVLTYHHAVMDGPSIGYLLERVNTLLIGASLPVRPNAVKEYLRWIQDHVGPAEVSHWADRLGGLTREDCVLLEGGSVQDEVASAVSRLPDAVTARLRTMAKSVQVTPACALQALWTGWLSAYTLRRSVCYGLVISTRDLMVCERAVGPFVATLPWYEKDIPDRSIEGLAHDIQRSHLDLEYGRHLSLASISKVSRYASLVDCLLTISTGSLDGEGYEVVAVRENTGYTLAADVDLASARVSFASSSGELGQERLAAMLDSFLEFCANGCHVEETPPRNASHIAIATQVVADLRYLDHVRRAGEEALGMSLGGDQIERSFIDLGGDSVMALRLCGILATVGLDLQVATVLRADSLATLANFVKEKNRERKELVRLGFEPNEGERIPMKKSQARIVSYIRQGLFQDFQEQAAFALENRLDLATLAAALQFLALKFPTLRMRHPAHLEGECLLTSTPIVDVADLGHYQGSLNEFADRQSAMDLLNPLDIESGPLVRVRVARRRPVGDYIFISLHALVADGWSFSTLLRNLFAFYADCAANRVPVVVEERTFLASCLADSATSSQASRIPLPTVSTGGNVARRDFSIDGATYSSLEAFSRSSGVTMSTALLAALAMARTVATEEVAMSVYDAGRHRAEEMEAVGPFATILPLLVSPTLDPRSLLHLQERVAVGRSDHAAQQAENTFFVFENYPREAEANLRQGSVPYFKERGDWRRDLLPPESSIGVVFEVRHGGLGVDILWRTHANGFGEAEAADLENSLREIFSTFVGITSKAFQ